MLLPDFLGIGAPRAGSTWLHDLLASHPEICMPTARKEIDFFDRNFEKGVGYYSRFFRWHGEGHPKAIGEVSPHYLYSLEAAKRIAEFESIRRIIVIFRDPVRRSFSHYLWLRRYVALGDSIQAAVRLRPIILEGSRYSRYYSHYLTLFPEDRVLPLVAEEAFRDPAGTSEWLAGFLGVGPDGFSERVLSAVANPGGTPRYPRLFWLLSRVSRWLRGREVNWPSNLVGQRLGLAQLLGLGGEARVPTVSEREWLREQLAGEVHRMEEMLGRDLSTWWTEAA